MTWKSFSHQLSWKPSKENYTFSRLYMVESIQDLNFSLDIQTKLQLWSLLTSWRNCRLAIYVMLQARRIVLLHKSLPVGRLATRAANKLNYRSISSQSLRVGMPNLKFISWMDSMTYGWYSKLRHRKLKWPSVQGTLFVQLKGKLKTPRPFSMFYLGTLLIILSPGLG